MALNEIVEWCGDGHEVTGSLGEGRSSIYCHEESDNYEEKFKVSSSSPAGSRASVAVRGGTRLKWETDDPSNVDVTAEELKIESGAWDFRITPK